MHTNGKGCFLEVKVACSGFETLFELCFWGVWGRVFFFCRVSAGWRRCLKMELQDLVLGGSVKVEDAPHTLNRKS